MLRLRDRGVESATVILGGATTTIITSTTNARALHTTGGDLENAVDVIRIAIMSVVEGVTAVEIGVGLETDGTDPGTSLRLRRAEAS